ncbi:MAG: efflux RND transporter periplasmic adaptor subunit [Planctomycetes bacterium]|nr:efflux RND transporter periplasmic adaptor subunit [Planctomycetota bacterium]
MSKPKHQPPSGHAAAPGAASKLGRYVLLPAGLLALVALLMLWLAGAFHTKITGAAPAPGRSTAAGSPGDRTVVEVRLRRVPQVETAVGTVRAVHETAVASKLLARVLTVRVTAGQRVGQGDVLVELDAADLRARMEQADAAAAAARIARDHARVELDRLRELRAQQAAPPIEVDRATATLKSAEADVARTHQSLEEARTVLAYATVAAPLSGLVIDKRVEVGDTVAPGQVLVTLFDPTRMQLVASVRESLTRRLSVGQNIDVEIDALAKRCQGQVSEIVPEAESASRSFTVKVTGPCPPGIYSGMFGRLYVPLDDRDVLVIPEAAIRRIGQLDVVDVVVDVGTDAVQRRVIQPGAAFGVDREVLSGLRVGERVVLPAEGDAAAP